MFKTQCQQEGAFQSPRDFTDSFWPSDCESPSPLMDLSSCTNLAVSHKFRVSLSAAPCSYAMALKRPVVSFSWRTTRQQAVVNDEMARLPQASMSQRRQKGKCGRKPQQVDKTACEDALQSRGFVQVRNRKHSVWHREDGERMTLANTPSDCRAHKNALADIRRRY